MNKRLQRLQGLRRIVMIAIFIIPALTSNAQVTSDSWDIDGHTISIKKEDNKKHKITGELYVHDIGSLTDIIIIAPGGAIRSGHMSKLARALALKNHGVFVVDFPFGYAVLYKNFLEHSKDCLG